jgi:molybdopterin-synthase adenylyltransferase
MTDVDEAYLRSVDIFNPDKARPVSIIGCGSIGSFAAETLAKMGVQKFNLYDGDIVTQVNVGCQRFGWNDLGKPKVDAVRDLILANSPVDPKNITTHFGFIDEKTNLIPIPTIVGVDNMTTRSLIWKKLKGKAPIIIDGRIGGQIVRVFSATNDYASIEYYEQHLYTDEEAEELPCTRRNVCYVANITQGIIGRMMRNYIEKGFTEKEIGIDVETFINYVKE